MLTRFVAKCSRAFASARYEQAIRRQVESEIGKPWDSVLDQEGRRGPARLTREERSFLMGLILRQAILWGAAAESFAILAFIVFGLLEGNWNAEGLFLGPLVTIIYFIYKRTVFLDRLEEMWAKVRSEVVEEEIARRAKTVSEI